MVHHHQEDWGNGSAQTGVGFTTGQFKTRCLFMTNRSPLSKRIVRLRRARRLSRHRPTLPDLGKQIGDDLGPRFGAQVPFSVNADADIASFEVAATDD